MPLLKILSACHDDGEKLKRFRLKVPTIDAWLEVFRQDEMPDCAVGILLNLDKYEVVELKSCIRHELRFSAVASPAVDIYYPATEAVRKLLCQKGAPRLGWHLSPSKTTTLIRSAVVFAVSLEFPHLFKEPASLEEYRREWTPNAYSCFTVVPHHFRREVLVRLVDICADEMKQNKRLRSAATDPRRYTPRPASPEFGSDTAENKRARTDPPQLDPKNSLKREYASLK